MGIVTIIVAALATWEIIEIWHHSSVMAPFRARVELWENFCSDLLRCPFCMAPYTALACLVGLATTSLPSGLGWLGWLPAGVIHAFAVARLANLGNDLGHAFCRTVRYDKLVPAPPGDSETAEQDDTSFSPKPVLGLPDEYSDPHTGPGAGKSPGPTV